MSKTILITGSTDGIGLETAKKLGEAGHTVLLHGRSEDKLEKAAQAVGGDPETCSADLSDLAAVEALAEAIIAKHDRLDVLINNAGVLKMADPLTADGLDARFMVNTLAPYLLTRRLLPIIPADGRVVNLSSAAQAPVDLNALAGKRRMTDMDAYSQSKLAITMWSFAMASDLPNGPVIVAVNPGSLLGSKMVKEGFGTDGKDLGIGADILARAATSDEFADASGTYFDNDSGRFANPHRDALDPQKTATLVQAIEAILSDIA